jgi:hypothetical protein
MRYMRFGTCLLPTLIMVFAIAGSANKKEKKVLPATVLKAQTVTVVIQSGAREPMSDPTANLKVQQEVEKALLRWGRFRLMPDVQTADLVIAVQKGTGKATETTVGGGPVDNRPVIVEGTDNSIRFGGHQGTPPATTQYRGPESQRPSEGIQIAGSDDRMAVYLGGVDYPLDGAPIWNYAGKDALKAPDVKAVEEFRKAIAEAEKAAHTPAPKGGSGGTAQAGNPPTPKTPWTDKP